MGAVQTYQGYFKEDGRFVSTNLFDKIPARRRVIVNVLDDEVSDMTEPSHDTDNNDQLLADIKNILTSAEKSENTTLSESDWNEMARLRSLTNLSRIIDL